MQKEIEERRKSIATRIRRFRRVEKAGRIYNSRSADQYIQALGLTNLFDYVRDLHQGNIVLDVGAGEIQAINDLSKMTMGKNIDFHASVLRTPKSTDFPKEKIHITPAETLGKIPSNSVSAIMSVVAASYSVDPEMVTESFNRVLVPGGVTYMTCGIQELGYWWGGRSKQHFVEKLRQMGFDVATREDSPTFVAIKPGGSIPITAEQLYTGDIN